MVENSFEGYIDFFIFYIISITYNFYKPNLNFWVQKIILLIYLIINSFKFRWLSL